jgi:2-hydroxychromene-2-carboxylate isomerase
VPSAPTVDFWFEFASTYSYPAALRVEQLAAERGVAVAWRPFLLGPIFAAQGWNDSPFNVYPVKGRYMWRDLARICAAHDIPLRRPSQFPRGSLLAARVVARFAGEPWIPAFVRAVYRANFAEDLDISTPDVVGRCLAAVGAQPAGILEQANSPDAKARLRANTDEAIRLDIFGAPSFVVRGELFWGHDRLEDALRWAVERAA